MTDDRRPDASTRPGWLARTRTDRRWHAVAVILAVAVGLAAATAHWSGLVLGGMLVGLVSKTLPRAVLGGVAFGVVALLAFGLTLGDALWPTLEMAPVTTLVVAAAFGLPVLGSLARGIY